MINLIWAMDRNYLIGKDNKLPWKIPAEMKYFSQITSGSKVLMGSKTFESIGKPLKNRCNIVVTRSKEKYKNWQEKNLVFTDNWKEVLKPHKNNPYEHIFVIGGREIYQLTYPYADYYYISIVKGTYEGNIKFPFPNCKGNEKLKSYLLEELFKDFKLIKKEKFPDFTTYIYKKENGI